MKKRFTILAILSAFFSVFPFLRARNRTMTTLLWLPKLLSGAFSLWLALVGIISVLYGWMRRDHGLVLTGGVGAVLSLLYIRRVTRTHKGFEKAFGQDWQKKIPSVQYTRLQRLRWPILSIPVLPTPRQQDVVYGNSPSTGLPLLADLWLPRKQTGSSGLGIIYIHGGAWRLGSKDMGTAPFFLRLASLGHVVMDIEYTLFPHCSMIDMVHEVKLAIAWLKANAGALAINPDRIILMGGSAGAHLALLTGYTPDNPLLRPAGITGDLSVRGVVAFYPPVDFRNLPGDFDSLLDRSKPGVIGKAIQDTVIHFMNDALRVATTLRGNHNQPRRSRLEASLFTDPAAFLKTLIGGSVEDIPARYNLLSPAAHVESCCPPTLLLQGTDDFFQLLPGVQRLYKSLQAAGVPSILVEFPYCEHAFDLILPQISPAAQAATFDVERFLALMAN